MKKGEVLKRINEIGIIPVVRANSVDEALKAIDAIKDGGVPVLEITMTVPGALHAIEKVRTSYGEDILVGAGTVLDPETARACIAAGARFVVSPSLNLATIELCRRYGVAVMPGALTPTEVLTAWQAGADVVKVFPCDAMGGAKYLRALKAPFPDIELIPTGGVSLANAGEFIAAGAWAIGIGSELVDLKAIRANQQERITSTARGLLDSVRNARQSA
jgi:2-dehydro-3-deoxyphosphogluconate aldolase / (4S)-4-hydroxy-2-oxoglutarate aldolase